MSQLFCFSECRPCVGHRRDLSIGDDCHQENNREAVIEVGELLQQSWHECCWHRTCLTNFSVRRTFIFVLFYFKPDLLFHGVREGISGSSQRSSKGHHTTKQTDRHTDTQMHGTENITSSANAESNNIHKLFLLRVYDCSIVLFIYKQVFFSFPCQLEFLLIIV